MDIIKDLDILAYLDVRLIMGLMSIGFLIKHVYPINKINNRYIPITLYSVALIIYLLSMDSISKINIINAIVNAGISGAVSIGLHNSSKRLMNLALDTYKNKVTEVVEDLTENTSSEEDND